MESNRVLVSSTLHPLAFLPILVLLQWVIPRCDTRCQWGRVWKKGLWRLWLAPVWLWNGHCWILGIVSLGLFSLWPSRQQRADWRVSRCQAGFAYSMDTAAMFYTISKCPAAAPINFYYFDWGWQDSIRNYCWQVGSLRRYGHHWTLDQTEKQGFQRQSQKDGKQRDS